MLLHLTRSDNLFGRVFYYQIFCGLINISYICDDIITVKQFYMEICFDEIYKKHSGKIKRYIEYRIKFSSNYNKLDSEELVNDVFIKANRYLHLFDPKKSNIKTWLYTITNTVIIDWQRTKMKKQQHSYDGYVSDEGFKFDVCDEKTIECSSSYDRNLISSEISKSISNLKEINRDMISLYLYSNLKLKDIATELNIPVGTVKGTIHRICKDLKSELIHIV